MSIAVILEAALVGVLALHAVAMVNPLSERIWRTSRDSVTSQVGIYRGSGGIDYRGMLVESQADSPVRRVAFLVRSASLAADIAFWNSVAEALKGQPDVDLVGYCDGWDCVETLRKGNAHIGLPIIALGQASDAQVVYEADHAGFCVVEGGDRHLWREGEGVAVLVEALAR